MEKIMGHPGGEAGANAACVPSGTALVPEHDLREILRLAKIGFYLTDACAFSYGDGYQQPRELSFQWEWQQSTPNTFGWEQLDADVEAFMAGFTEDDEPAPDLPLFRVAGALANTPAVSDGVGHGTTSGSDAGSSVPGGQNPSNKATGHD